MAQASRDAAVLPKKDFGRSLCRTATTRIITSYTRIQQAKPNQVTYHCTEAQPSTQGGRPANEEKTKAKKAKNATKAKKVKKAKKK